ncbi:MAG: tRNA pseudouridine(13) synthase TruD [Helicobacteraceae bacterium]|jgi:tRNA pseudouridine13 synthase|nr:tRNA pseudouridine(13) synthase TruD [Helicobacteraceae bacterium]
MKRKYIQDHNPVTFSFKPTRDDFIVDEIPLYEGGKHGNYVHFHIRKVDMSTLELIAVLEEQTNFHNISYAGLKDKYATTTQYISMPASYEKFFSKFKHPQIKILGSSLQKEKLNIGDLKGNRFKIRLRDVTPDAAEKLDKDLKEIVRQGIPNYFGYQRFGQDENHFEKAKEAAHGSKVFKDRRLNKLMSNAYQSYLFNDWLAERVKLSQELDYMDLAGFMKKWGLTKEEVIHLQAQSSIFKVIPGDVMLDVMNNKLVNVSDIASVKKPYKERKLQPTGLLVGGKAWRSRDAAGAIEARHDDDEVAMAGERRVAWIYPKEIKSKYIKKESIYELSFALPKGAYATVLLENLANRDVENVHEIKTDKKKFVPLRFDDPDDDDDEYED